MEQRCESILDSQMYLIARNAVSGGKNSRVPRERGFNESFYRLVRELIGVGKESLGNGRKSLRPATLIERVASYDEVPVTHLLPEPEAASSPWARDRERVRDESTRRMAKDEVVR